MCVCVCVCACVHACVCVPACVRTFRWLCTCGCACEILSSIRIRPHSSLLMPIQYILRMMAFGQLKDLLGVEVPDALQSFLDSRKRSSVDYSSDVSEGKKAKME